MEMHFWNAAALCRDNLTEASMTPDNRFQFVNFAAAKTKSFVNEVLDTSGKCGRALIWKPRLSLRVSLDMIYCLVLEVEFEHVAPVAVVVTWGL